MTEIDRDPVTGKPTTGHEWDGIKELNSPLPRWWLFVLYATIVWAIGYWVVYPTLPFWGGVLGFNSRARLETAMTDAKAAQATWLDKLQPASLAAIEQDPDLLNFAMAGGKASFNENCAPCHAAGGAGRPGFPNLADDDWLWGGRLEDIETTIRHGIRFAGDEATRQNAMPRFGLDQLLPPDQIDDVTQFVLSLSGSPSDAVAAERGRAVFAAQCVACHGETGAGRTDLGAPDLTDSIWLYGSDAAAIRAQIVNPRQGVMPAWIDRLGETRIKMISVYVHSLGGGQE